MNILRFIPGFQGVPAMGTLHPILAQVGPQEKRILSLFHAPCGVNLQGVGGFGEVARAPGLEAELPEDPRCWGRENTFRSG
jgi:hypothetical protein